VTDVRIDHGERSVSIVARGHAGYDAIGRDIVCAAISVLITAAAATCDPYVDTGARMTVRLDPADAEVTVVCEDPDVLERVRVHLRTVEVGLALLAAEYPQYIKLTSEDLSVVT
jgi:uncharacterized protein YsxB (DUF464 family)